MSIRRNTTYNLLGSLVPLAVSLVTVPIYLQLIGEARYGVLAIVWLLLGYFGLFDLGLGRATAQRIATLRDGTASARAQTFWTALTLNVGLGVLGGLLIWPIATYFFGHVFQVDTTLRPEMQAAVPWLILAVPMATLSGVLIGALQGRERFLELNLISVSGTALFQLLPLVVAWLYGPDLGVLLPTALFARLFTLLMLFARCRRHVIQGQPITFERAQAGQLLRFGGWVTVTAFIGPTMVILDRFVIGAVAGAKAVTYYTVPFQLGERSTILSNALTSALFPRFSAITIKEQQFLALEGMYLLLAVMTPLVATGVLLMESFLAWWINPAFSQQSTNVGQLLLLGFWINGPARISSALLQARARPDLVAKCHLWELLPYFTIMYFAWEYFGLIGIAATFLIRMIVTFAILARFAELLLESFRAIIIPALLLSIAFLIAKLKTPQGYTWLTLTAAQICVTTIWAWYRLPIKQRKYTLTYLKPLTRSIGKMKIG